VTQRVLTFDHSVIPQETGWWCGPASTQVVLNGRGIVVAEQELATEIGTTFDGTGDIDDIAPILNRYLGAGLYTTTHLRQDPPTPAQTAQLWADITASIDDGYGLVANIDAPPGNYPIGVNGSTSPRYGGGEVLHYIALMGYDDNPAWPAVYVADSGFWPFEYWISLAQLASLVPPKGYATARNPLWRTILTQFIGPPRR
jgi:hypothetical protein